MADAGPSREERISALLRHFGLERAHVAACMSGDWGDLITSYSKVIESLTLVCPMLSIGIPDGLDFLTSPVLVVTGDQGKPAERARGLAAQFQDVVLITLQEYFSPIWADVISDRAEDIGFAMLDFLVRADRQQTSNVVTLPEGEGEVEGLSYSVQGAGSPLILLPIALAPSPYPRWFGRPCSP